MSPDGDEGRAGEAVSGPAGPDLARRRHRRRSTLFTIALVLLVSFPVLAGVAQRLHDNWQPQGDSAVIAWLARDVFTSDSPLLGMSSSIGLTSEADAEAAAPHHWGPMVFWVLAVPQRLASNDPAGLQVGLLAFEVATIAGIVLFAQRRSGSLGALALLVPLTAATWSLGRVVLSNIWNPDVALLPVALLFVVSWSCAAGDQVALPFAALTGSFVVQCNILYTPLAALLLAWGVTGFVITRREMRGGAPHDCPRLRRPLVATCAVLLASWSTVIIEELTHRPGNVERVLQSALNEGGEHVGPERATYFLARAIGGVPFWSHPLSSERASVELFQRPSLATAAMAIGFFSVLVGGLAKSWRRSPTDRALLGTALCGLVGTALLITRLPVLLGVAPYRLRSVWITGAFAVFAVVWFVARVAAHRFAEALTNVMRVRVRRAAFTALALALTASAMLGATGWEQTVSNRDSPEIVEKLVRSAADNLAKGGPYLAVPRRRPFNGIATGVLWGLERRGFDVRVSLDTASYAEAYLAELHGPGARSMPRLLLIDNASRYKPLPDQRLVARVNGGTDARLRMSSARSDLCGTLEADPPTITPEATALLEAHADHRDPTDTSVFASGTLECTAFDHLKRLMELSESDAEVLGMSDPQWTALQAFALDEYNLSFEDFAIYVSPAP